MISCTKSKWRTVTSDITQRLVPEPVLFNIFIHNLEYGTEYALTTLAKDTNLEGMSDATGMHAAIQRNLDRLENWTKKTLMKVKRKMQSPTPEEEQPNTPAYTEEQAENQRKVWDSGE